VGEFHRESPRKRENAAKGCAQGRRENHSLVNMVHCKEFAHLAGARLGIPIALCMKVTNFPSAFGRWMLPEVMLGMAYKEIFWMACDSTEQLRAEYGPFHTRSEAEGEARRLGFGFLLRYEHMIGDKEDIQEVRCIFIELPMAPVLLRALHKLHTRCATCGESSVHDESWRAEVWADIHEFEHSRHLVRLFEQTRADGLKEIADWRDTCA
jgi:hypothetical protein